MNKKGIEMKYLKLLAFSVALGIVGMLEAYSQTAWRPVKPLVRTHFRKAVNKPPCSCYGKRR